MVISATTTEIGEPIGVPEWLFTNDVPEHKTFNLNHDALRNSNERAEDVSGLVWAGLPANNLYHLQRIFENQSSSIDQKGH